MKNYILFVLLFATSLLRGQIVFRHLTQESNIKDNYTILNHPKLNNNPNAILFIMQNFNYCGGTDPRGWTYSENTCVAYKNGYWTISSQNTASKMPYNITFNVLIAPPNNANYFTVTAVNPNSTEANGFYINNPATNNKTNALLLVTQNGEMAGSNNSPITSYSNGKWQIGSDQYMQYYYDNAKTQALIKNGTRFNVMVVDNNIVSGFSNAVAFKHISNTSNIIPAGQHIVFLDQIAVNGNQNAVIFATPYWGHGDADRNNDPTKAGGPYNGTSLSAWYDHPNDQWHHKDNYWSLHHITNAQITVGAKFHIVSMKLPALLAPVLVSPACGSVFNFYPRTTPLKWQPVNSAVSYTVEIDCFDCCTVGKWCSDVGKMWKTVPNLTTTNYTFDFVGQQPGR